jgi:TIR domain
MPGINRATAQYASSSSSAQLRLSQARAMSTNKPDCVFISHQKADSAFCKQIADYILRAGMDVYFDEYDHDLRLHRENNDPHGVTECILKGINSSNFMLCVVSPQTLGSTWVPFEVGYGFEKTQLGVLAIKGVRRANLPHYALTARFIVDNIPALNTFLRSKTAVINESRNFGQVTALAVDARHPLANVMNIQ